MHCNLLLLAIAATGTAAQRPTVTLHDGMYTGISTQLSNVVVNQFFGIPFADKPQRWSPAQLRPAGTEKRDATAQPPICIQQSEGDTGGGVGTKESEDCLFVNVFAPSNASSKPVLVWYHGGGLFSGSISMGNRPSPDGSNMVASQDIIVVAAQYRLGAFGFPGYLKELGPDGQNPGFRDHKLALEWVQKNIAAFGGDPAKVTIMGHSGGGVSVDGLIISSGGDQQRLFRAAIPMSGSLHTFNSKIVGGVGSYMTGLGVGNKHDEAPLVTLARTMGCAKAGEPVHCLRAKSAAELKPAITKAQLLFTPVEDGGKTNFMDSDSARRANKTAIVPVMLGNTFQEAQAFMSRLGNKTVADWAQIIYPNSTANQKAVTDVYSIGNELRTASDALLQLHSDYQFACVEAYDAMIMSQNGIPTYRYVFNASIESVSHGSDMSYVWGGQQSNGVAAELSRVIQGSWARFIKYPAEGPGWIKYGTAARDLADLGGEGDRKSITLISRQVMDSRCPVWYDAYDPARPK